MYADDALASMLHMRMQRAAVIEALQRLGVDSIEVTQRNVTDGAAFDLVMQPSESGFTVALQKIVEKRRGGQKVPV